MNLQERAGSLAGVTLIEMIAVVAVLVILIGIVGYRAGKSPDAARTAVGLSLVKDCRTAYVQMFFSEMTDTNLGALVAGTSFADVQLSRSSNILTVSGIPQGTLKSGIAELSINCSANLYNWDGTFKSESEFRQNCLW